MTRVYIEINSNHGIYSHIFGHQIVSVCTYSACVAILKINVAGTSFAEFVYNTNNYFKSGEARDKMTLKTLACILI